jgi:Predicted phosphosugar isomerases
MNPWDLSETELIAKGAVNTAREICQQPEAWLETLELLQQQQGEIKAFVEPLLKKQDLRIIFTGAGTSAYAGDIIAPYLREKTQRDILSVATTDIVAAPLQFLLKHKPTLLVSFARSGDSPESIGAFDFAEQIIDEVYQIVITCNPKGALAQRAAEKKEHTLNIYTPPQTNDLGFAMTSSFTSMLLSGLMLFDMKNFAANRALVERIVDCTSKLLTEGQDVAAIGRAGFERLVFLGTGSLQALAKETCLKVLELTAGKKVAVAESIVGFRHGPKSIVNDKTLVVMLFSADSYTHAYEMDFLRELNHDEGSFKVMAVCPAPDEEISALADYMMVLDPQAKDSWGQDAYLAMGYVVFDHILALAASMAEGVAPDTPCPSGSVNRVVKGVVIYPLEA